MAETLFQEVNYNLGGLINLIELGEIGLPDIQRPFVWKNVKVRNLFDSMYRGFPIGYLLFWQNQGSGESKTIGIENKQKVPRLLIVDGQQRLTSLYAVLKGVPVLRENYEAEPIHIAFNPLLEKFEVADAAIRRDKSYIHNISKLWSSETDLFGVVDEYMTNLEATREVSEEERKRIRKAITKVYGLLSYPLTALELSSNSSEEEVSEIFVRINSEGKKLNQSDFILTLMSVFWDKGRKQLEDFCRDSRQPSKSKPNGFNYFIKPDPDQLLRVSVGLGFKRARLQYVYSILRGKDLKTEQFSAALRDEQFKVLQIAQEKVLNIQHWHDFFKVLLQAGYRSEKMVSSKNNLLFAYTLYLIGRTEYKVEEFSLRQTLARWFFMSSITGRYTDSPESKMEFDLARFREVKDADSFVSILNQVCDESLPNDFWTTTLPTQLATSSSMSPSLFAFYASLNLLDAKVLFSNSKVSVLLDPAAHAYRSALETHHLFPKSYLKTLGITELRETNQIANFALVEWGDNAAIADQPPSQYVPALRERFASRDIEQMYYWHAMPDNWESIQYKDFLQKRRELMAKVIHDAFKLLSKDTAEYKQVPLSTLIQSGESHNLEFKSTLRMNLHTGQKDPRMELSCLKTIAGFLNTKGGTLIIGVSDSGEAQGIEEDQFENEDKMSLHLVNLIKDRISSSHMMYIHPRFEEYDGKRVLAVECSAAKSPAFVKDGGGEKLFIRTGASTTDLGLSQAQEFMKQRFAA